MPQMEVVVNKCVNLSQLGKRKRESHSSLAKADNIRDGLLFLRTRSTADGTRIDSKDIGDLCSDHASLGPGVHLVPSSGFPLLQVSFRCISKVILSF